MAGEREKELGMAADVAMASSGLGGWEPTDPEGPDLGPPDTGRSEALTEGTKDAMARAGDAENEDDEGPNPADGAPRRLPTSDT
jgi:hypothetical protein